MNTDLTHGAEDNFFFLKKNPYPGRIIIQGMSETGKDMVQVYAIMGRSPSSRNRMFGVDGGRLFTETTNATQVFDPLTIYDAMQESGGYFVVSNGHQTSTVLHGMLTGKELARSLIDYEYEPDAPHHTQRITGVCSIFGGKHRFGLAILRMGLWNNSCDRICWHNEAIGNGFGLFVSTYSGNGDPLPSFRGDPLLMPLKGNIRTIAATYWQALNEANKVAIAVKRIPLDRGPSEIEVINKFTKV